VTRVGDGAPNQPGWRLRVVPNLYPIVGGRDASAGATGEHEVVIFPHDHDQSFGRLDAAAPVSPFTPPRDRCQR